MLLNLHTHLEGCVRPATAALLAAQAGVPEPVGGWADALRMRTPGDLTVFLAHVAEVYPVLGSAVSLHRVAFEAVQDAAADGQSYVELRVGPGTHARADLSVRQALAAVSAGVSEAARESGIFAGVVACMLRHEPQDVVDEIAGAAVALAGAGVVGLDVAGDELLYPSLSRYAGAFALAREAGLGVTAHAAEAGPAAAAREAVELLGVRRIGHGSRLVDDPDLLAWAHQEGVCVEVCPSSNVLTGAAASLAAHPVHALVAAGVAVVLGDDDPVTTGVRLGDESRGLVSGGGLPAEMVAGFSRTAIEAAFCSDSERRELRDLMAAGTA